jgi:hypothetical protein
MRCSQLILFLLISHSVQGQIPAGLANTYDLSQTMGYSGKNYVSFFKHTNSGKIYAKDYLGGVHIIGNNTSKPLLGYKKFIDNSGLIIEVGKEIWVYDGNQNVIHVKDDSVVKILKNTSKEHIKGTPLGTKCYGNRIFSFYAINGMLKIYELKKRGWAVIIKVQLPQSIKAEDINVFYKRTGFFLGVLDSKGIQRIYKVDAQKSELKYVNSISNAESNYFYEFFNENWENYIRLKMAFGNFFSKRTGKPFRGSFLNGETTDGYFNRIIGDTNFIFTRSKGISEYLTVKDESIKSITAFEVKNYNFIIIRNPYYPYLTALTGIKAIRIFPYIKKYPRIYDDDNSNNIFTITQDNKGRIWAGSYNKDLSIIDKNAHVIALKKQAYAFMDAAINYNNKIYFVGESGDGGILQYNMKGNMRKLLPQLTAGYYLFHAKINKKIYFPSAKYPDRPVYYCDAKEIEKQVVRWKKLDRTVGIESFGFQTITEDTLGRIWMGHSKKGFAVYNPKSKRGITYDTRKQQSQIGFMSSLTDIKGTVWMGSAENGLWYYNDYHKDPTPANIQRINHPLLNKVNNITAMTIYKNWLVLSCYDRICLLDLDSFYKKGTIVIKYLNQQEAALTSSTEQNTMLTSKTDSTIWFSTSDMLYQWDIKTWLNLPNYRANVSTYLQHDSTKVLLNTKMQSSLKAGLNSFDLFLEYLSPDGLPRYTRSALVKDGDKLIMSEPGNQSQFSFKNQNSGRYTFYVEIYEQDGTTSRYEYRIIIQDFFWKQWWFWILSSFILIIPIILWLNTSRKRALMAKEISQLNVITLSSQFRPHFILNALNTIGADLKDKPLAESIISRLGESINVIFNQSQQKVVCHSLKNEWLLVENVIQIHRIMYLPELDVSYFGNEVLKEYENLLVPLGILETNVENALLHGLRNKHTSPYSLSLKVNSDEDYFYFEISDNGIGRKAAVKLTNYKKHGTGIKNLNSIIDILNKFNKHKISIIFLDNHENIGKEGTVVNIKIPKEYRYEY